VSATSGVRRAIAIPSKEVVQVRFLVNPRQRLCPRQGKQLAMARQPGELSLI
jgi:hypothetical protein